MSSKFTLTKDKGSVIVSYDPSEKHFIQELRFAERKFKLHKALKLK